MEHIAHVNGDAVVLRDALRREILKANTFLPAVVDEVLLRQYAQRKGIRNSPEEIQVAADETRYAQRLESVEATDQWLRERHQTLESFQDGLDSILTYNKVAQSIGEDELRAYYAEHLVEFDRVELYSIRVADEELARELAAQIRDEGANFHVLAMEHSEDDDTRRQGGYVGSLGRGEMTPEIEAVVFKQTPGAVVGPFATGKGFNLFKVASVQRPAFAEVAETIRGKVFHALLTRLRSEARIDYPLFGNGRADS